MSTDEETSAPPGWIMGQPFPKPEAAAYLVKGGNRPRLGVRLATGSRPKEVPGAYWYWLTKRGSPRARWLWLSGWVFLLGCAIMITLSLSYLLSAFPLPRGGPLWFWLFYFASLVFVFLGSKTKVHFARHVLEHEGLVCFDCGYLLKGLPDEYRCPECNAPYEKRSLQQRWLQWMQDPKQP